MKLSRRSFIVGTAAAGGGLAVGMRLPFGSGAAEAKAAADAGVGAGGDSAANVTGYPDVQA